MDKQCRRQQRIRHAVQALWTVVTNSYWIGFVRGRIYQGKIKNVCVPGLNCYSCPGAVASCPIGALQATIGSYEYQMAFYVAGFMILVGTLMGTGLSAAGSAPLGWYRIYCTRFRCPSG